MGGRGGSRGKSLEKNVEHTVSDGVKIPRQFTSRGISCENKQCNENDVLKRNYGVMGHCELASSRITAW